MATAADPTRARPGPGDQHDDDLLAVLEAEGRIVHIDRRPERTARTRPLATPLPERIATVFDADGLWSHQAEAIDLARAGTHVVVATGTASGKSRCFQIPIAEAVADPIRPGTALALYPTKALGHDQLRALDALKVPGLVAGAYDGDASPDEKAWTRAHANVVVTNPEMLHAGLLPRHHQWAPLLMRLRYVVIDEAHVLRGVFGSHVAQILRRLRRVCRHHGSDPTFIFCSATVGDPARLAGDLCGEPVVAVTDDGSPAAPRRFALLDPPVIDEDGRRTGANSEAAAVTAALLERGHRTITFCRSRKAAELVAADVARRLPPSLSDRVMPYRAGYLADERRDIECRLASGELRGVVTTSALELGVDIGGLDACVMNGFPGTIASMWQQAGRAGRRGRASTTVLVAGDDQLDRYLMAHPREVFERAPEPCVINPTNPHVTGPHLACAAYELPLSHEDLRYWPDELLHDGVRGLVRSDELRLRRRRRLGREEPYAHWCGTGYPAGRIGLRSGSSGEIRIVEHHTNRLVGTIDERRAHAAVHEGAVYLHQGRAHEVVRLDLDEREARVVEIDDGTYTQARRRTELVVTGVDAVRALGCAEVHLGSVEVTTQVTGYQLREARSRRILSNERLDLPEQRLATRAFWLTVPAGVVAASGDGPGALHAAEHAAIAMMPLFAICDRWDIGGLSTPRHSDTGAPTIFVYDAHVGGAGIAEIGHAHAEAHLAATAEAIAACPCADGCPSCVQSPKCGNGNEPLDKAGALRLLRAVLTPDGHGR